MGHPRLRGRGRPARPRARTRARRPHQPTCPFHCVACPPLVRVRASAPRRRPLAEAAGGLTPPITHPPHPAPHRPTPRAGAPVCTSGCRRRDTTASAAQARPSPVHTVPDSRWSYLYGDDHAHTVQSPPQWEGSRPLCTTVEMTLSRAAVRGNEADRSGGRASWQAAPRADRGGEGGGPLQASARTKKEKKRQCRWPRGRRAARSSRTLTANPVTGRAGDHPPPRALCLAPTVTVVAAAAGRYPGSSASRSSDQPPLAIRPQATPTLEGAPPPRADPTVLYASVVRRPVAAVPWGYLPPPLRLCSRHCCGQTPPAAGRTLPAPPPQPPPPCRSPSAPDIPDAPAGPGTGPAGPTPTESAFAKEP